MTTQQFVVRSIRGRVVTLDPATVVAVRPCNFATELVLANGVRLAVCGRRPDVERALAARKEPADG